MEKSYWVKDYFGKRGKANVRTPTDAEKEIRRKLSALEDAKALKAALEKTRAPWE